MFINFPMKGEKTQNQLKSILTINGVFPKFLQLLVFFQNSYNKWCFFSKQTKGTYPFLSTPGLCPPESPSTTPKHNLHQSPDLTPFQLKLLLCAFTICLQCHKNKTTTQNKPTNQKSTIPKNVFQKVPCYKHEQKQLLWHKIMCAASLWSDLLQIVFTSTSLGLF